MIRFGLRSSRFLLLASILTSVVRGQSETTRSPRQTVNFNREWKFTLGDPAGAEVVTFADAAWQSVGLPHSFSIPYFQADQFYVGYGWYRKHFAVGPEWRGKQLFLEFDGAFQVAEVFVNGRRIGEHHGGYTGFSLDITAAVKTEDNVVAVRVNNLWNPQQAPRTGDHTFSGGIYRNVRLVVTDPLHVTWCGTFVTTPEVSAESSLVNIKTEVANTGSESKKCQLVTEILDPKGTVVATVSSSQTVPAGEKSTFDQTTPMIASPRLWDPSHPSLYSARARILSDKTLVDNFTTPFGFRWVKWTADQGFFINGEHLYFHGANVHQDHAGWGDAATDGSARRDVKLMKDAGFDFIRGSHYPHSPAFSEACDQQGMLFWSEVCDWNGMKARAGWFLNGTADPENFEAYAISCKKTLREMIRIHRNHPSIIIWSMSNEAFFTDKSLLPQMKDLAKDMVALSHELDPTRLAAIGGCQREGFDKLGDVAGYNGDGARLFIDPGIPNVVSEYGSVICNRPGEYAPGFGDLEKQPQFAWRSGQAIWCGFDHGTWLGRFGRMGIVDYYRLPKRSWYWYRNEYLKIPPPLWPQPGTAAKLRLTADKTTILGTGATDDIQLIVTVLDAAGKPISNNPVVTLTVESGPGEFPTGPAITFDPSSDIEIRDGQAAMAFRSYDGGKTVIRATSPGLTDAVVTLTTTGLPAFIPGQTAAVKVRPYKRFEGSDAPHDRKEKKNLVKDLPTRASSEAPEHSARFANDGSTATYWSPANEATNPWWQVDLESLTPLATTKLTLRDEGLCCYKIEVSEDAKSWKTAVDQTRSTSRERVRADTCVAGSSGRFLRITFTELPTGKTANLAEFEVHTAAGIND